MKILPQKPRKNRSCINHCFKWLYIILYYVGCLCFQPHRKVFRITTINTVYTYFVRLVLLSGFVGSTIMKCSGNEGSKAMLDRLSPLLKFELASECLTSTVTYIIVSGAMERNKYKHIQLIKRFQELDHHMLSDFPNINWNYHKTVQKYTTFTLGVTVYYYFIAIIYIFKLSNCNCDYVTTLVLTLSYASMTVAPGCVTFLHLGMMDLQRIRFRLIRRLLKQYYASSVSIKREPRFELRLECLIDYCKNYIQLILNVNDVFGLACGIGLFQDFTLLAKLTFLMCQKATEANTRGVDYTFIFLFMLPRLYKVVIYAIYGYATHREQRNCTHEVKMCENHFRRSKIVRRNLEIFLHWQMQNSYTFLIGKVTRCNLVLLYSIVNSIVSSVIILIQLQFQQNNITTRMKNQEISDAQFTKRLS